MDRKIPRKLESKIVQVDSAFRRIDEPVHEYNVFFDSLDQRRSNRIRDVVGLRINKMSLPKVHDNIIAGMNVLNVHVSTSNALTRLISSEVELIQYLNDLNPHLVLTTSSGGYKLSSVNGNQLLTSTTTFPGGDLMGDEYAMLISSPKRWDITYPVTLSLSSSESHRILMKPGYYPTSSLMLGELFEAFGGIQSNVNENLQYYHEWNDMGENTNGWSIYKEPRGRWVLYFRSFDSDTNMELYFSREPGGYDILQQLGLRSSDFRNWANSTVTYKQDNTLFKMTKHTMTPPVDSGENTIIGRSSLTYSNIFELQFEQINLSPRRYVDVLIRNVPQTHLVTNGTSHSSVFARVDLSKHNISYSSNINTVTQSNLQDSFDEASSSETYAIFESNPVNNIPLFDPISLDHLEIQIVDNMGHFYTTTRDHTMEIELTVMGDASVPFDFPVTNIGSVPPHRRSLVDLPEDSYHRKRHRRSKHMSEIKQPSPMTVWFMDNRVEVGASVFTFFAVLSIAYKFGVYQPQPQPQPQPQHHPSLNNK